MMFPGDTKVHSPFKYSRKPLPLGTHGQVTFSTTRFSSLYLSFVVTSYEKGT